MKTKISPTELDYTEAEAICLDYFLGESCEIKELWAQRVWQNCERWEQGLRTSKAGNKLDFIYAKDPYELWEEKKRKSRAYLIKEKTGFDCPKEFLDPMTIKKDLKLKRECNWPVELSDEKVIEIKTNPFYSYKKAVDDPIEERGRNNKEWEKYKAKVADNIIRLKDKGFDKETIGLLYPESEYILAK